MHAGNRAEKPNAALEPFKVLVGTWNTEGTHPYLPGKMLHGQATFEWLCGGAFLLWRSVIVDDERVPNAVAVFGSDDKTGQYFMLYVDERAVSRKYDITFENNVLRWERITPDFSQRMVWTISADRKSFVSSGEMSRDGEEWEPDLQLTYTRTGSERR